ncbi:hypothetical protein [Klebsiella variicola]|uniref:hypothetical protein n=1 Tax=Klebsiella variicola TaxID=244366 RepID=UPI000E2E21E1|nr:hypothetical protein [Klebsiella variicola]SXE31145.1 Uncharacterised protein [Klebsiella variicola]
MSNLPEQPAWESGIHQLEESDRAKAGPGGILNLQASQLANRTNWLRILVESASDYREYTFYKSESDPDGTIAGLANTPDEKMFRVAQGSDSEASFVYYLNHAGVAMKVAEMPGQGSIAKLNETVSELAEKIVFDDSDSIYFSVIDSEGNVIGVVRRNSTGNAVIEFKNHALADQSLDGIFLTDADGTVKFAAYDGEVLSAAGFSQTKYSITQSDEFSFVLSDAEGNVCLAVGKDGKSLNKGKEENSDSEAILIANAAALSAVAGVAANTFRVSNYQRPRKKLNIYLTYGQSYSIGSDSERLLSTSQYFANLTLGTNPRGENTSSGASVYTFSPTGGEVLYPLIESGTESPVSGLINTLKWLHNESLGVDNDEDHLFAGAATGVSAVSIASLTEGANPERYNRLRTALSGFANAAATAGYDACVAGVIYIQGEADNTSTYDVYYAALQNLFNQINGTIKQFFPNNKDVDFFIGQMGGYFVVDTNNQAIPRAQMDFCDAYPNAHFVGPYAMLPCPSSGYHLLSNSYRWFYSNIAKAVHKVMQGYEHATFRINSVRHRNNELIVGFNVPVPPLKFRDAYIKQTATMFNDKGFTVTDSTGTLRGADLTVEIVAPTVIKITCSRSLSGDVRLTLGDRGGHSGRHNISDSDPSVSMFKWETNPDTSAQDYIPALNGKNYPLHNWCGIDSVLSKEVE